MSASSAKASTSSGPEQEQQVALPDRYIAYLFDDVHLKFGDLSQVRTATEKHLATL